MLRRCLWDDTSFLLIFISGREAIKGLVKEGRKVAQSLSGPDRKELEALCDDVEALYSQLDALIRKGMVSPDSNIYKYI